jgi:hypothetical protein
MIYQVTPSANAINGTLDISATTFGSADSIMATVTAAANGALDVFNTEADTSVSRAIATISSSTAVAAASDRMKLNLVHASYLI